MYRGDDILKIYDQDLNNIGRATREEVHTQGLLHQVAHVWMFQPKEDDTYIMIQKRALDRELYPGKYDLIQTTHFDPDESYEEAIVDSLEYYRGLKKSKEDIIHVGSTHQQIDAGDYHDNALVQVFAIFTAKALFIMPDTEEIVKVRFEDFRQLIHGKQNTIKLYSLDDVYLKEKDISNIGKALGAFRAGQLTLAESADILLDEIESVYMAGASGFYVDAKKSLNIGQIPPCPNQVYQIGNTSLAMAKDIVLNPELLDELQKLADKIESNHIMLATSEIFEKIYSLELAIYEQGMPFWMYNQWLQKYGIQEIPNIETEPEITKLYPRDIADLGDYDLNTVDIENTLSSKFDRCIYCMDCVNSCPENALSFEKDEFKLRTDLCSGLGCLRCAGNCKEHAFKYEEFYKDI